MYAVASPAMDFARNLNNNDNDPFLDDVDIHSPANNDFTINNDFNNELDNNNNIDSANIPYGSPYAHSYHSHHSPYGSEYDFGDEIAISIQADLDEQNTSHNEYDPSDYDAPGDSPFFTDDLMASLTEHSADSPNPNTSGSPGGNHNNNPTMSPRVSVTGAYSPFDHGSPNSSGGEGDNRRYAAPADDARSRASSVSSTHGMEHMTFASPNPSPHNLPWQSAPTAASSSNMAPQSPPAPKPQSPPQLFIPNTEVLPPSPAQSNRSLSHSGRSPVHETQGGLMPGPGIHIVPATPVSGGGGATQPVPFQQTLETLQQGEFTLPSSSFFSLAFFVYLLPWIPAGIPLDMCFSFSTPIYTFWWRSAFLLS
ncbi:hypothetical protein BD410DRAFT_278128 [Rickenella mellea]|uniref:Uncharacterized protein n=1 Tax=Rickenella mellea TaxID=50990 RepID=A0A4Y7PFI2_9AGAM|nr:hypothetical protein BD410DRAFT_278128 [Rickenella mellea]